MRKGIIAFTMLVMTVSVTAIVSSAAFAVDPTSANYRLNESSIGSGSSLQSTSTSFKATNAVGDAAIGNSKSTAFQTNAGSNTSADPNLSVAITSGAITFPDFSAGAAAVTTATFSILNYTSYGYVVQIAGTAPTNNGKILPALATNTASTIGVEQFGINLVANTSPSSIGSNPDNGQYGFGGIAPNYATPNSYRYVNGETIALAAKSSGQTNYTITLLVNVAGLTPGGQYSSSQTLIVTGTY